MEEVTREEFSQLASRVSVVEREVEGEKLVTRYILEQTRRNGDDLAAIKGRLGRVESRLDGLDRAFEEFAKNLPAIVGDAVRQALREHGKAS